MPSFTFDASDDADKLPTLKQWMSRVSKDALEPVRIVKVIWFPNMYQSYSLDTEAFRLRVSDTQSLFAVLQDHADEWIEQGAVLGLQITGSKRPKVTLMTLDNEECEWDPLGEFGYKASQFSRKKKQTAKTRITKSSASDAQPSQDGQEGASE